MYGISRYLAYILQWSLAKLPVLLNMSCRSPKALEMSVFLLHLYLLVAKTHGEKRHLHDFIQSLEGGAWPAAGNENPAPASHEQSKCYVAPSRDGGYRRTPPAALFIQTDWIPRVETNFLWSLSSFGPLPGNKNNTNSMNIIMLMSLTTRQFSPGTAVSY